MITRQLLGTFRRSCIVVGALLFAAGATRAEAIHDAVRTGDMKKTKELLAASPELIDKPDDSGKTPLIIASGAGHREIVSLLLNKGADINFAVKTGPFEGYTPLCAAVLNGRTELALTLLTKDADHAARFKWDWHGGGYTPLHMAAHDGNLRVIRALIDKKADVNALTDSEHTPLLSLLYGLPRHDLKEADATTAAKVLINAGTDPKKSDKMGTTPLHQAVKIGYFDIARALIDAKADVNAQDEKGLRPLTTANKNGDTKMIKLLKDHGAIE